MRFLAFAAGFIMAANIAYAADFPGPKVLDVEPFNNPGVMAGGSLSCPNFFDRAQLATNKTALVAQVKTCIRTSFGIEKDIGLDFGNPRSPYAECVVPKSYDARPPANNPMWPVCCPVELLNGKYRMACRLFFTNK
jgi:hypothetical protein